MILADVNILVYAHRKDSIGHDKHKKWLLDVLNSPSAFGVSEQVLCGFIRIVTHPKIFMPPTSLKQAFAFAEKIRTHPNAMIIRAGENHWNIFRDLCEKSEAVGNLVPDAYFAALAIESGSEWITCDRDYSRFPGLKWRTPF